MRLFLSAGEASGDAYAAALVREIKRAGARDFTVEGIGGKRLKEEGATLRADSSKWGAISIVQALKVYPRVVGGYYKAKAALGKGIPGLFIPIDFGYANIRLARHAKSKGWKVLYFIPPGSWRKDRQGKDLPGVTDAIVTPFPWSAELLNNMGANAHWFGHPIRQLIRDALATGTQETYDLALLPGSRHHEVSENLPAIAGALQIIDPEAKLRSGVVVASSLDPEELKKEWLRLAPKRTNDEFRQGASATILSSARAGVVCSGTATLEAALCHCPMVVVYKVTRAMAVEAKILRIRPKMIALPNILLDRFAIPELIHTAATPEAIAAHLQSLLADSPTRQAQLEDFKTLESTLGPEDAITKTAQLAVTLYHPAEGV